MKEKFLKIISLLKNKRYRAIVIILLYLIFFGIMFLILFLTNKSKPVTPIKKIFEYKNYDNYEFSVNLNVDEEKYYYNGKRYKDMYEVSYDDQVFDFKIGDDIELNNNVYDSLNFDPSFINELIRNSNLISETKLVEDDILEKKYNLSVCYYTKITDYVIEDCDPNLNILITVGKKNDEVIYVDLVLDDLFSSISSINKYSIKIIYTNINKVLQFS